MTALPDPHFQAEFYDDLPMKRLVAWGVDAALILLLCLLALPFTAFTALFFLPLLWLTLSFFYRWTLLARNSATPGMRLMAIEFRDATGQRFDPATAFAHTTIYTLATAFILPQMVSVALIVLSPRHQSLADHLLGSAAINRMSRH